MVYYGKWTALKKISCGKLGCNIYFKKGNNLDLVPFTFNLLIENMTKSRFEYNMANFQPRFSFSMFNYI